MPNRSSKDRPVMQLVELYLLRVLSEDDSRNRKVDNGGVFLNEEVVLGKSFDAEDEIGGKFGQLESLEEVFFVGLVLLWTVKTEKTEKLRGWRREICAK